MTSLWRSTVTFDATTSYYTVHTNHLKELTSTDRNIFTYPELEELLQDLRMKQPTNLCFSRLGFHNPLGNPAKSGLVDIFRQIFEVYALQNVQICMGEMDPSYITQVIQAAAGMERDNLPSFSFSEIPQGNDNINAALRALHEAYSSIVVRVNGKLLQDSPLLAAPPSDAPPPKRVRLC